MIEHFQNQLADAKEVTPDTLADMISNYATHLSEEEMTAMKEQWLNESLIGQKLLYFVRRDLDEASQVLYIFEKDVELLANTLVFVEQAGNLPVFEAK